MPMTPKQYLGQDEALKAKEAAESLPEEHPDRVDVTGHLDHLASPDAYRDYYRTIRGGICPEAEVFTRHKLVTRFTTIRRLILERKHKTVLDLGCLDGWQLLNLAASGVTGLGIDLCPEALKIARERASKWGFDLAFIASSIEDLETNTEPFVTESLVKDINGRFLFDAVILSEVLEHVLDPAVCIQVAARQLAKDGILYVSVPATPIPHHGKLEDAREHLRVFSEADLRGLAEKAGLAIVEDHELIDSKDGEEIYTNRTISFRRAKITVYCNHVTGGWRPDRLDDTGASEEMVVKTAEAWARAGHAVTVHQNGYDGVLNGVAYLPRTIVPEPDQDLLVLFKTLEHMDCPADTRVFWTTDLSQPGQAASFLPPRLMESLDAVVCISDYHRQELLKACAWLSPEKTKMHWLGVDSLELSASVRDSIGKRVIYASSLDRGLGYLLEEWPKVREAVPEAELRVAYGFDFWKRSEAVLPAPQAEAMRIERSHLEELLKQPGVTFLGRLPRQDFLREMNEASIWAYPCTGGELCCKTALEAQFLGLYPVVIPTMSLAETVFSGSKVEREQFTAELIRVLKGDNARPVCDPLIPKWDDLATYLWGLHKERSSSAVVNTQEVMSLPTDTGVVAPAPLVFDRPRRNAVPVTSLDIIMAVRGMPFDGNTDREKNLGGCVTGNTLVDIPRDLKQFPVGIPITEVCERLAKGEKLHSYSYDHDAGKIVLRRITKAWRTRRNAEVWELTYSWISRDGDEQVASLRATPDHRIMLRDGTYKSLDALQSGDSLMPFNRFLGSRKGTKRYFRIDMNDGTFEYEHRFVVSELGIRYAPKRGMTGDVIHHKNYRPYDNSVGNLRVMDWKEHLALHEGGNPSFREWYDNLLPDEYKEFCGKQKALSQARWSLLTPEQRSVANRGPARMLALWNSNPTNMATKAAKISIANKRAFASPRLYMQLVANGKKAGYGSKGRKYTGTALENLRTAHRDPERCAAVAGMVKLTWARYSPEERKMRIEKQKAGIRLAQANHVVLSVKRLPSPEDVYDLEVEGTHNFVANGIIIHNSETAAAQLSRELVKRGHRVSVFSNLPGQPGKFDGVNYLSVEEWGRYAASTCHDVSIVQRDPMAFSQPLKSKVNVLWCHDLGLQRYRGTFRPSLWNVDYVAPVSHWHGRQLTEVYDLPSSLIVPMRNGVDVDMLRQIAGRGQQRDRRALVYASRPERGLDVLLQAIFPRLLERDPELTLYIAGYENTTEPLREFYAHCQQLIANFGSRAKWMGYLKKSDLYNLYSRAGCYVYPSRSFEEVSCISSMEAAACGLPFVGTTLGALPETTGLVPGYAQLVPHPGDDATEEFVAAFVDACWNVLTDKSLNDAMSAAGRDGATAFSWAGVAQEWEDFLLGALEQRSGDGKRIARQWWRLGDLNGLQTLSEEDRAILAPEQQKAVFEAEVDRPPLDIPFHVVQAVVQVAVDVGAKTCLNLARGSESADAVFQAAGLMVMKDGPVDFVFGIETLDCSEDPHAHIQEAESLVVPGGHVCLILAAPGTHQDRLTRGTSRRQRWVFDNHDARDLLGKKRDLLIAAIGGGAVSAYDHSLLTWSLYRWMPSGITDPSAKIDLSRRRWLQAPAPTLSACLIVKNAENMLHRCLKSIEPYCDEIIVDDTGSTDSTKDILAQHGIQPASGLNPLDVGFDEARNNGLRRATGDFVLWIDADEELLEGFQLPKYLRWSMYDGFGISQHHFSAIPPNAFKPDLPVRLFRRTNLDGSPTGIRWWGFVHEHPEKAINESVGQSVVLSDVHIAHEGYLSETIRRQRFTRNIPLMFRDRLKYPQRVLGKFLMIRDWCHLARYQAEQNGGHLTPEGAHYLEAAVEAYRRDFLGMTHVMAADGLQYYNEALQMLGRGFDVQLALKVGGLDGTPHEVNYSGRIASAEDLERLVLSGTRDLTGIWKGKYL